jgi:hypothetical protein
VLIASSLYQLGVKRTRPQRKVCCQSVSQWNNQRNERKEKGRKEKGKEVRKEGKRSRRKGNRCTVDYYVMCACIMHERPHAKSFSTLVLIVFLATTRCYHYEYPRSRQILASSCSAVATYHHFQPCTLLHLARPLILCIVESSITVLFKESFKGMELSDWMRRIHF